MAVPRVTIISMKVGYTWYYTADSVMMLLMDMHVRAKTEDQRALVSETIENLRQAQANAR